MPETTSHLDYLPDWVKAMEYGLMGGRPFSSGTIAAYKLYARVFLEEYGEISVQNLKRALLNIPVAQYAKRHKTYQALQSMANYLAQEGLIMTDYLAQSKAYIPKRHIPPKKITVHEKGIETLIETSSNTQEALLLLLLASTGLRVSEATSLKWADIDLENGYLTVRLAKWGKTRRVGIIPRLKQQLEAFRNERGPTLKKDDPLFFDKNGVPITRYGIRTRFKKLAKRTGIEVTPHALRRAFVTINANKGRPLSMLQIACGHSDITTTRSYCMTTEDETIEAMQGWE